LTGRVIQRTRFLSQVKRVGRRVRRAAACLRAKPPPTPTNGPPTRTNSLWTNPRAVENPLPGGTRCSHAAGGAWFFTRWYGWDDPRGGRW
jgi:hypothetical protein